MLYRMSNPGQKRLLETTEITDTSYRKSTTPKSVDNPDPEPQRTGKRGRPDNTRRQDIQVELMIEADNQLEKCSRNNSPGSSSMDMRHR